MYERLILFPFVLSFVDNPTETYQKKADNSLAEKFKNNKEGILKWLVDASIFYHNNPDIIQPQIILEAKAKYNRQVNVTLDFIDTLFIKTDNMDDSIKRSKIIELYKAYMDHNGFRNKCKPKTAEREFDDIIKSTTIKNIKYYIGIKLKDTEEHQIDELN